MLVNTSGCSRCKPCLRHACRGATSPAPPHPPTAIAHLQRGAPQRAQRALASVCNQCSQLPPGHRVQAHACRGWWHTLHREGRSAAGGMRQAAGPLHVPACAAARWQAAGHEAVQCSSAFSGPSCCHGRSHSACRHPATCPASSHDEWRTGLAWPAATGLEEAGGWRPAASRVQLRKQRAQQGHGLAHLLVKGARSGGCGGRLRGSRRRRRRCAWVRARCCHAEGGLQM